MVTVTFTFLDSGEKKNSLYNPRSLIPDLFLQQVARSVIGNMKTLFQNTPR